jgi:hypothetical protein
MTVRILILALVASVGLGVPPTAARERPRPKRRYAITGTIKAPLLEGQTGTSRTRPAYWSFGLDELQEKRPALDHTELLVFLDLWEDSQVAGKSIPDWYIEGSALVPRCFVVPRRAAAEGITIHNRDPFFHALASADLAAVHGLTMESGAKATAKVDVLPLEPGKLLSYRVQSRDLATLAGELVFLRSSAYVFVDAKGAFELKDVPEGEYTLSVFYRGKVYLTKRVAVARKTTELGQLTIDKAP